MAEGVAARRAAVDLLDAVLGEGRMLSQAELPVAPAAPQGRGEGRTLGPADRARAQRLALATLRMVGPADTLLAPLLRKTPPLRVLNLLRLSVVELAGGAAAHGVVNAAVDIARQSRKTAHLAGLVNAVLRAVPADGLAAKGPQKMPRWLRQPLVHAWGREAVGAMETVQSAAPPVDLTLRHGRAAPPGAVELPTGSWRIADPGQISALPGYAAGDWWVQDAGAAMAVRLLDPKPGERILDLCAAPGGKTLQLADAGARVTALDISASRMARVTENLARTGLEAETVVADALDWSPAASFDAILLDAPCSATGTIRRHPDLPFVKDGSELPGLADLQARLLDRALGWLAPGGRLVFCTCSVLPEEGEAQIAAALLRHPGLMVGKTLPKGAETGWMGETGLRLRPDFWADRGGMDGFFMACLHLPLHA